MGLFKKLGCIALGATLGPVGSAVGYAVGYAVSEYVDNERDAARREGFEDGFKTGEIESKKKFMEMLKEDDNLRLGVFALSLYVANLDGLDDSEVRLIETQIGSPDSIANAKLRERFQAIYNEDMSFSEIDKKFLSGFSVEILKELDIVIQGVIQSDNEISDKEREFMDYVWKPYLNRRLQ